MTTASTPARKTAAKAPARKTPQDRKPKAEPDAAEENEVRTISIDGLELVIDRSRLDDIETLEEIVAVQDGNEARLVPFLRRIFGLEQYALIKKHVADEDGRTTITAVAAFFRSADAALNAIAEEE